MLGVDDGLGVGVLEGVDVGFGVGVMVGVGVIVGVDVMVGVGVGDPSSGVPPASVQAMLEVEMTGWSLNSSSVPIPSSCILKQYLCPISSPLNTKSVGMIPV